MSNLQPKKRHDSSWRRLTRPLSMLAGSDSFASSTSDFNQTVSASSSVNDLSRITRGNSATSSSSSTSSIPTSSTSSNIYRLKFPKSRISSKSSSKRSTTHSDFSGDNSTSRSKFPPISSPLELKSSTTQPHVQAVPAAEISSPITGTPVQIKSPSITRRSASIYADAKRRLSLTNTLSLYINSPSNNNPPAEDDEDEEINYLKGIDNSIGQWISISDKDQSTLSPHTPTSPLTPKTSTATIMPLNFISSDHGNAIAEFTSAETKAQQALEQSLLNSPSRPLTPPILQKPFTYVPAITSTTRPFRTPPSPARTASRNGSQDSIESTMTCMSGIIWVGEQDVHDYETFQIFSED